MKKDYSGWAVASFILHVSWMVPLVVALLIVVLYGNESMVCFVLLLPLAAYALFGLPAIGCGMIALTLPSRHRIPVGGQAILWAGIILGALLPLSGLFWSDFIRWCQRR